MRYLLITGLSCFLSVTALADTLRGQASGRSALSAPAVLSASINGIAGSSPTGTFVFSPSANQHYSCFPETFSVCIDSKGMQRATGTLEGYYQLGSVTQYYVKGNFEVDIAPGSKGAGTVQFFNYTTGAVVFPQTTYNFISGGFGMVGEPCGL